MSIGGLGARVVARVRWRLARRKRVAAFRQDFKRFRRLAGDSYPLPIRSEDLYPCIDDSADGGSGCGPHYFFHLAWAARVLAETRPEAHVDVGSHRSFCAIVSGFLPVTFLDLHVPASAVAGLSIGVADLRALPLASKSVESLSCMHVVEHVGLGRYGDGLDPHGDRKAVAELCRVLAPGGQLLLVVPVGRAKVVFNAHRIYSFEMAAALAAPLELREFALISEPDAGPGLTRRADPGRVAEQDYACGCFHFVKRGA